MQLLAVPFSAVPIWLYQSIQRCLRYMFLHLSVCQVLSGGQNLAPRAFRGSSKSYDHGASWGDASSKGRSHGKADDSGKGGDDGDGWDYGQGDDQWQSEAWQGVEDSKASPRNKFCIEILDSTL